MATTLHIDVDQSPVSSSGVSAKLRVHRRETYDLPAADVVVTVTRSLPPWQLREILTTAADRLCADDTPQTRSPYPRRNAA